MKKRISFDREFIQTFF